SKNNLVLRCPDGMARFDANGNIAQRKGIWVLAGNNTYVEGFEFYGAAISYADGDNGAGIRVGGNGLTCRRCYFHDNQEGILTANDTTDNNIFIEACEFDHNGVETGGAAGFEHNIYVGHSTSCSIKFCYFHASIVGHEIKTRANRNYILYNHIVDGPTGDGSYSIDMPNGGLSFVIGNSIEKGPTTANSTVISYGEEGIINPDSQFYFVNNTVVTDRDPTTFLNIQPGTKPALIANNIFAGQGHPIAGFTDTVSNVFNSDTSFFHFVDPANYDYHTYGFPGFTNAVNLAPVDGFSLIPISQYVDPEDSMPRADFIQFDNEVGAFEYISGGGSVAETHQQAFGNNFPNPFDKTTQIVLPSEFAGIQGAALSLYDATGALVLHKDYVEASSSIEFSRGNLASGVYFYRIASRDGKLECFGSVVVSP
ncbi:MAG: T9SS type A sorting domain-containing protein, partial [Candidatus Kapaibacterium sp.]